MNQPVEWAPNWARGPEFSPTALLRGRISHILAFLGRRYISIILFVLLSIGVGLLYLLATPPIFTATATMMLDTRKQQFQRQSGVADVQTDSSWMDTQIGTVKSVNVALLVVKRLHLSDDPKFAQYESRLARYLPARLSTFIDLQSDQRILSEEELARLIVAGLEVKRIGISYMLRIDFSSYNAEQTVRIVNAIVDAYTADQLNARDEANRRTSDWLQERFQTLREQASAAERAVVDFKSKNNIVIASGKSMNDQNLSEISTQLNAARAHTQDVLAHLARIQAVIQANQEGTDATVSEEMSNPIIEKLRSQFLELQNRADHWAAQYGPDHLAVANIHRQMQDIKNNMVSELSRIAETYKSEYEISRQRQDQLEKAWTQVVSQAGNPSQISLHSLESAAESYHTLYNDFLQRYMESVQQQSFPANEARLMAPAPAAYKSSPKDLIAIAVASLAGGVLGLGFGLVREVMDGGFRTSAQVRSALDTDCIALIPRLQNELSALSDGRFVEAQIVPENPRTIAASANLIHAIVDQPLSRYAEAFRAIKLALDTANASKSAKRLGLTPSRYASDLANAAKSASVLGLTSSLPEEGKSTIAAGLAELAAMGGRRVVLVDCDFRNPSLSRLLAPEATVGLLDVVSGKVSLEEAIWRDPVTGLEFLPASGPSPSKNSSEVFWADATRQLFEKLRLQYDYILVDLAPLIPIVDARAAAHLIDFYLLVIEWGSTKVDMVQHVLSKARAVQENIIGAVLNKVEMTVIGKYERQNPEYQRKTYARYGSYV